MQKSRIRYMICKCRRSDSAALALTLILFVRVVRILPFVYQDLKLVLHDLIVRR